MSFTKQSNRLDDALIAGHITHDQYLAAGGRTPETMLRGLREGSDALVKRHGIREIRSARDLVSPEAMRRLELKKLLGSRPDFSPYDFPGIPLRQWEIADGKLLNAAAKQFDTMDDAALDELYSKLNKKGDYYSKINDTVESNIKADKPRVLNSFLTLDDTEASAAYASPRSHLYAPTADGDTLGTKLKNLVGLKRNALDAEFEAELIRRHEIDEYRYDSLRRKNKKTLMSFGHVHPRVIVNEHENLARGPQRVREYFIDRRSRIGEAPAYSAASEGKFEYGKGLRSVPKKPGGSFDFNAAKRSIENSIADEFYDNPYLSSKYKELQVNHFRDQGLGRYIKDGLRNALETQVDRARESVVGALIKAPDASLLGRLSNFIIKHSEYSPANKSHLKTAYEMGAQEALRRAGI